MVNYVKALNEVLALKGMENNKSISLDFSDELDYSCICEMCGGSGEFQKEYPLLYEISQNTKKHHVDSYVSAQINEGFVDLCHINDCSYDSTEKQLNSSGTVALTKKAKRIFATLTLQNGDKILGCNTTFGNNCSTLNLSCDLENIDLSNKDVKVIFHATWELGNTNLLNSYVVEKSLDISVVEVIDHIDVVDPTHKVSALTDDIAVCYARIPIAKEKIDYTYPEARTGEGHQKLFLDNSGSATLKKGYTFDKIKPNNVNIVLFCKEIGGIFYNVSNPEKFIKANATGCEWKFDRDWNNFITESVSAGNRQYEFDMQIMFYVKEDNDEHLLKVSSYDIPKTSHCKKISKIHLYWGCLAENTLVLMENGNQKIIKDIQLGEVIITNPSGMAAKINNIWSGTDETLYCVCSDNGSEIYATKDHPFMTETGFKPLIELTDTDKLLMSDGQYCRIKYAYPIPNSEKVYNLDLEGDTHTMVCNGFVVGDNDAQGEAIDYLNNKDNISVDEKVIEETKKLHGKLLLSISRGDIK